MAGSQTIGQLRAILVTETGQFVSDLGKARQVVRDTGKEVEASGGLFSKFTTKIDAVGPAMKGAQAATAGAAQVLRLVGAEGSAAVTGLSNAMSGLLMGGFTPLGLALAGVSAAVGYFVGKNKEAEEQAKRTAEAVEKEAKALDKVRTIEERRAEARAAGIAKETGLPAAMTKEMEAIARLERDMAAILGNFSVGGMQRYREMEKELDLARKRLEIETNLAALRGDKWFITPEEERPDPFLSGPATAGSTHSTRTPVRPSMRNHGSEMAPLDPRTAELVRENAEATAAAERMTVQLRAESLGISEREVEIQAEIAKLQAELADMSGIEKTTRADLIESLTKELELTRDIRIAGYVGTNKPKPTQPTDGWQKPGAAGNEMLDEIERASKSGFVSGLSNSLQDIARNGRDAGAAMREFGADFAWMVAEVAQRQAITAGLGSLFGAIGGSGAIDTQTGGSTGAGNWVTSGWGAGAAHGGTFKVGGFGGLDSKLVAMKLSPGELVRVSNGANSRGEGGDVHVAMTVRPPAVVADEVAAKMNPQAKAAIVYSALSRGGRRGARAKD